MKRTEAQAIVDDIETLHAVMTPDAVIARKLHLPLQTVQDVAETGRLPTQQPQRTQPSIDFEA
ncbi:hypothetical protein [Fuerstiella marisgermanici]|uniref:Uncharacterized protein n=1 Tax=Fuerstiella marisgermanici TaxID=1891926 RepID=A0A1P8WKP3_9PLAN|nr:hypothetical protein [Fuerstiella marisgermanici]APZ94625.1 hypothetical protein Fuma_04258 [Fuerstiella marisgermanici]